MIKHIIALLLVTPAWIVMAQLPCNLQIRGIVLDATDSAYISNAEVFIEQGHLRTYSGTNGKFSLKNVCSGLQLLEFEKSGFEHVHAEIKITSRLIGMPQYVLDYVLLHELVHLIVNDHGKEFDAFMKTYEFKEKAEGYLDALDELPSSFWSPDSFGASPSESREEISKGF